MTEVCSSRQRSAGSDLPTVTGFPCNLRDLGGLPVTGGGRLRSGLLFRGDDPGRGDTATGDRLVRQLGIRHVIDLRHSDDVDQRGGPGPFAVRPEVVHHPLPMTLLDAVGPGGLPETVDQLAQMYADSVVVCAATYLAGLHLIAELDEPALIHCSHGKDRTGVLVALVLSAVGVEPEAIVADFGRTAENLPTMHRLSRELGISIGAERLKGVLLEAPAAAMSRFLELMSDTHGDPLAPLFAAGLRLQAVERLRERLIGPRS